MNNYGLGGMGGMIMGFGNDKVKITHLSMYTTRTDYQKPYQRSYTINATAGVVNRFQGMIAERGKNTKVNPLAISSAIPDITSITALPSGQANIVNGWETERLRFIMVAETPTMAGTKRISFICGFTEFSQVSASGLIDPNMVFYINSFTNVQQTIDRVNNRIITTPSSTYNVVTDMFGNGTYTRVDGYSMPKLARPRDIVENAMTINMHDSQEGRLLNTSGSIGQHRADTSQRVNNDPLQYYCRLYNAAVEGRDLSVYASDEVDVLQNACDTHGILETPLMSQPFMQALHKITGEITPHTFTMNILLRIDPDVTRLPPQVFIRDNVGVNMNNPASLLAETSDTADTLNPTAENLKAVTICNSINSMMIECLITRISVSLSNKFGENTVILSDVNTFIPDVDLVFWSNRLISKIKNILMPSVTDNGLSKVEVHIISDITKDTTISISVNDQPNYIYRFPTYADSLYTPVVTSSENKAMLTEGFTTMFEASYI